MHCKAFFDFFIKLPGPFYDGNHLIDDFAIGSFIAGWQCLGEKEVEWVFIPAGWNSGVAFTLIRFRNVEIRA